ncbi:MAG TPA: hypothetical protein VFM59_04710 [Salinimicrobium sp.]|nr:hypothetical protein [Salinimicrobium sp.]
MNDMTTKKKKLPVKDTFRILSFIFVAILVTACSKKVVFPTSEVLPAAEAVMKVDKNDNNNYVLELEIENMAKPGRLQPARRTYVVWMVTDQHGTINIGNLNINNNNKASLETITPYKPIRIFITAEDDQKVIVPSTQVVLNSDEFNAD